MQSALYSVGGIFTLLASLALLLLSQIKKETNMENLKNYAEEHGVFFFLLGEVEKISQDFRINHLSTSLIKGLRELGIKLAANVKVAGINETTADSSSLWVVDVSGIHFSVLSQERTIDQLRNLPAKHKIFVYTGDSGSKFYFPDDMPLLIDAENRFLELPGKRIVWAYGLYPDLMDWAQKPYAPREDVFLANFRPSLNQSLRQSLDLAFVPNLERHFKVDKKLSNKDQHLQKLSTCLGCLAYGGTFEQDLLSNPAFGDNPFYTHPEGSFVSPLNFKFHQETIILRWDSWRIWEAFACGALVVQPIMEKYGFVWPEMPTEGEHYVGIDLANPQACIDFLVQNREKLPSIAQAGQAWAVRHYSPRVVAERFLKITETITS